MQSLPEKPYVYFYSSRWSFNYETRQYLAPDVDGEDRSREFGRVQGFGPAGGLDRSLDSLVMLLPPYTEALADVRRLYPGGQEVIRRDGDQVLFIAYHLPAVGQAGAAAPRPESRGIPNVALSHTGSP
jgi:hypothetical protein